MHPGLRVPARCCSEMNGLWQRPLSTRNKVEQTFDVDTIENLNNYKNQ